MKGQGINDSSRDNVNVKKKKYFLVHVDRENVQGNPDFDACMETHITHTYDTWRTQITHTHDVHMETYTNRVTNTLYGKSRSCC